MATATDTKSKSASDKKAGDSGGSNGGKKLLLIIVGVVVLVAAGAAGAYFFFNGSGSAQDDSPPPLQSSGQMVEMDTMTLSLADHHYLKLRVAIELAQGDATPDTFNTVKASQLVIQTFSDRAVDDLSSNAARATLKKQLLTGLQKAYPREVYQVYLTQFVIQ